MGFLDIISLKKDTTPMAPPEVGACDRKLAELATKKKDIIYQVGQMFVAEHSEEEMQNSPYEVQFKELSRIAKEIEHTEKRKLAVQGLRKCESCGNVLVIDSAFCNKCGSKLEELSKEILSASSVGDVCPDCGAACDKGAMFCTSCGKKLM